MVLEDWDRAAQAEEGRSWLSAESGWQSSGGKRSTSELLSFQGCVCDADCMNQSGLIGYVFESRVRVNNDVFKYH